MSDTEFSFVEYDPKNWAGHGFETNMEWQRADLDGKIGALHEKLKRQGLDPYKDSKYQGLVAEADRLSAQSRALRDIPLAASGEVELLGGVEEGTAQLDIKPASKAELRRLDPLGIDPDEPIRQKGYLSRRRPVVTMFGGNPDKAAMDAAISYRSGRPVQELPADPVRQGFDLLDEEGKKAHFADVMDEVNEFSAHRSAERMPSPAEAVGLEPKPGFKSLEPKGSLPRSRAALAKQALKRGADNLVRRLPHAALEGAGAGVEAFFARNPADMTGQERADYLIREAAMTAAPFASPFIHTAQAFGYDPLAPVVGAANSLIGEKELSPQHRAWLEANPQRTTEMITSLPNPSEVKMGGKAEALHSLKRKKR